MRCPTCDVCLISGIRAGQRTLCCPECCREWTPEEWDRWIRGAEGGGAGDVRPVPADQVDTSGASTRPGRASQGLR
jgi:hypothetical protein